MASTVLGEGGGGGCLRESKKTMRIILDESVFLLCPLREHPPGLTGSTQKIMPSNDDECGGAVEGMQIDADGGRPGKKGGVEQDVDGIRLTSSLP